MQDSQSECVQSFSIQNECLNKVNPSIFTNELLVYSGKSVFFSSPISINITEAYTFDSQSRAYQKIDLSQFQNSSLTVNGSECTCSGLLKEVHYLVYTQPNSSSSNTFFSISSISATVVISSNPVSGQCSDSAQISQKYSIQFVTSSDISQVQSKSGNPGYITGLPVLVGQVD